ncbi:MAG: hypothetical protein EXQ90_01325 [Rhodospirillales bacterium]|nr:hypothetical protein [Rhodospirillales bacterium]
MTDRIVAAQRLMSDPDISLDDFRRDGYAVVSGYFSDNYCDELVQRGSRLVADAGNSLRPVLQPHRLDSGFMAAMKTPALARFVGLAVGGVPKGLQTSFIFMQAATVGYASHQDNFFVEAPNDAFVSIWVALADAHRGNGCLYVYPGTHRRGRLPIESLEAEPAAGQDINARREQTIVPLEYKAVDLAVTKGSVVFLHSCLVHGSHDNQSTESRPALVMTYIRAGQPFRPGSTAKREEVDLDFNPQP